MRKRINSQSNFQFEFNQFKRKVILHLQQKLDMDLNLKNIVFENNQTISIIERLITFDKNKMLLMINLSQLDVILKNNFKRNVRQFNNQEYIEDDLERLSSEIKEINNLFIPIEFTQSQKLFITNKIKTLSENMQMFDISYTKSINIVNNNIPKLPILISSFNNYPVKNLHFTINGKNFTTDSEGKIFLKNIETFRSINISLNIEKSFHLSNISNKLFFRKLIAKNINFHNTQIQINKFSKPIIQNSDTFFDDSLRKLGYKISRKNNATHFIIKYITLSAGKSQIQGFFAKIKGDAFIKNKNHIVRHFSSVGTALSLISIEDAKKKAKLNVKNSLYVKIK
jgi:hypothetical protein